MSEQSGNESQVRDDRLIVGAVKRPDGTMDFSRALSMGKEMKISDPIVDRLRGPLVIDGEREAGYSKLQAMFVKREEDGSLGQWVVDTLNKVRKPGTLPIKHEDLTGLKLVMETPYLQSLRGKYQRVFRRPTFTLPASAVNGLYQKMTGYNNTARGFNLTGGALDKILDTHGMNLSFNEANVDEQAYEHELDHTIDPYLGKRALAEQVLAEVAVFYRRSYEPMKTIGDWEVTDRNGNVEKGTRLMDDYFSLERLQKALKDPDGEYANPFARGFDSVKAYQQRVDDIIDTIKELEPHMTKPDINKAIFNSQSFYELQHLLDVVKREKGIQ
jgi:hypothetical protein